MLWENPSSPLLLLFSAVRLQSAASPRDKMWQRAAGGFGGHRIHRVTEWEAWEFGWKWAVRKKEDSWHLGSR